MLGQGKRVLLEQTLGIVMSIQKLDKKFIKFSEIHTVIVIRDVRIIQGHVNYSAHL